MNDGGLHVVKQAAGCGHEDCGKALLKPIDIALHIGASKDHLHRKSLVKLGQFFGLIRNLRGQFTGRRDDQNPHAIQVLFHLQNSFNSWQQERDSLASSCSSASKDILAR